ncbi:hypothetical protein [Rhabdaerophilum sp. SD176]|uniref:hypothetical protein n=1 Tax=Rhabdaerophilum sp. SD176 TaxID=2983548 RepID=UPI0024DF81AD|nr:hypothetical protein [Rhabdaerophilum sp. SD176]
MTKLSNTHTAKFRKASRFSMLALALSLSTGTVAGMFGIAAMTSGPVQAQSANNGGGGGPAGNGSAGGGAGPMMANPIAAFNPIPNEPNRDPNNGRGRIRGANCEGSQSGIDSERCKNNPRSTPRIVRINGFSNCAIIQQVPSPQGGPAEFYCVKPM